MRARGLSLSVALLLAGSTALAQERPRTGPTTVTYRSQSAVYVSAGRAAGLAVGDRLAVMTGTEKVAELEVVFLAEHSSSCRVVSETQSVKLGDRVVRLGPARPAASPAPPSTQTVTTPAPAPAPAAPYESPAPRDTRDRFARATGGVSVGWSTFRDSSEAGRDVEERLARFDLTLRDLGGRPLEARLRGSGRQIERDGLRGPVLRASDSRQRLYEASLAWVPADGRFSAAAGRLGAHPFVSLGYLDGVIGQARPTSTMQVGGFFGRTPDALDVGLPSGAKYGAFLRYAPSTAGSAGELVVSGVRELAGSEVSREYLGQQAQLRLGDVWLYQRMELDVNRGWRRDRAGTQMDLSEARVLLSWRASPQADLSLSYDRSRNYWSALTRVLSSELFDRRLRQTVRADLALTRPGGMGAWLGGSVRTVEGDEDPSYSAHGGVRSRRFAGLDMSLDASYYKTPTTQGLLGTARAGRTLRAGHRLDASYIVNRYETSGLGWRLSHWVRASAYAQALRRAFGRADVEYALQDELPGLRASIEVGYRF